MAWAERTSLGWQALLTEYPEALAQACDIRENTTVEGLVRHIVAVELRYAERLSDAAETPYEAIPFGPVEGIYATHEKAMELLNRLDDRDDAFWEEKIEFSTRRGGSIRSRRRTVFVHLLMHSIRHYAQLATLLRQHGIAPNWQMDYLAMGVEVAKVG